VIFLVAGLYLAFCAHRSLTRHGTPLNFDPSTCLIQDRLYRHSRNAIYAGFVAFLAGLSALSGNVLTLLCPRLPG